jgi:phage baseplate assembly protein W
MATRVSRSFKDFNISFKKHPITNDLISITNESAIKNAVINLVRTRIGERFFQNNLGTDVENSLFELQTSEIYFKLENEINQVLKNFEPRIFVNDIKVIFPDDTNEIEVKITYNIIGIESTNQQVNVILKSTRI